MRARREVRRCIKMSFDKITSRTLVHFLIVDFNMIQSLLPRSRIIKLFKI